MQIFALLFSCLLSTLAMGQQPKPTYTEADTLLGSVSNLRNCYDVKSYDITVRFNLDGRSIKGKNSIGFKAVESFNKMQLDLAANMRIKDIKYKGRRLKYTRKYTAVSINMGETVRKGVNGNIIVQYEGSPQVAKNPPWDGGFIYTKDKQGKPWAAVACQGLGAHIWLPVKDSQSDEAEEVTLRYEVPMGLTAIGNGRLIFSETMKDGYQADIWRVMSPINTYNITFYIGNYVPQASVFNGSKGKLDITYWALDDGNAEKYFAHYAQDVPRMLSSFEDWFGPYPFYADGYKMVQAPYAGMEHQSAIGNGNGLRNGYLGRDLSGTGQGMFWDFMTVHESGHEWWGNSITTADIADMWVHESFTNYSEALFVESVRGKAAGQQYAIGLRKNIKNDEPIIGPYGVNKEGSGDMYYKGANMLNMLRAIMQDDAKFKAMLRGLNANFYHKLVTGAEVERYIIKFTGLPLAAMFNQYLRGVQPPTLAYNINDGVLTYNWERTVPGFNMPVDVHINNDAAIRLQPGMQPKTIKLDGEGPYKLEVDGVFYVLTRQY